jgi:hypothetical protein
MKPTTTYELRFHCKNCDNRFTKKIPVKHQVTYSYGVGANVIFNFEESDNLVREIVICPRCQTTSDIKKDFNNQNDETERNTKAYRKRQKKVL